MADAPMSRRARRTLEEEAAERAASQDPTLALPPGFGSGGIADADEAALSRRDRRRRERLAHPLEAWTAEEEMLATGQIPTMTPERIAEQEKISREKAARAAQEAAAASQEFRRLAQSEIRQAPAAAVEVPQVPEPESVPYAPEPSLPEFGWPEPVAPEPVWSEPVVPETVWSEPAAPETAAPAFDTGEPTYPEADTFHAGAYEELPVVEDYQPHMALDDTPLPNVHHAHDSEPIAEAPEEAALPVAERSNIFEGLFPAGSSQSMLRQQDPFAAGADGEPVPAESEQIPTLLPPQEVPVRLPNAADEMRRLAADAMSGIERTSQADAAAAASAAAADLARTSSERAEFEPSHSQQAQPPFATQESGDPRTQQGSARGGALAEFSWPAEDQGGPSGRSADADPTFDSFNDPSRRAGQAQGMQAQGMQAQGSPPQQATFDQLLQPDSGPTYARGVEERGASAGSGSFPAVNAYGDPSRSAAPASGQFPISGQTAGMQARQAAPQGLAGPQGPAWASHPLNAPQGRAADPNDFTPLANVPRPDFSGLYQPGSPGAFPPLTGAINTTALNNAEFHSGDVSSAGQLGSARRPDLSEVGGAKHFKWLHLAVIGALVFVLGVVIYHAAFAQ